MAKAPFSRRFSRCAPIIDDVPCEEATAVPKAASLEEARTALLSQLEALRGGRVDGGAPGLARLARELKRTARKLPNAVHSLASLLSSSAPSQSQPSGVGKPAWRLLAPWSSQNRGFPLLSESKRFLLLSSAPSDELPPAIAQSSAAESPKPATAEPSKPSPAESSNDQSTHSSDNSSPQVPRKLAVPWEDLRAAGVHIREPVPSATHSSAFLSSSFLSSAPSPLASVHSEVGELLAQLSTLPNQQFWTPVHAYLPVPRPTLFQLGAADGAASDARPTTRIVRKRCMSIMKWRKRRMRGHKYKKRQKANRHKGKV